MDELEAEPKLEISHILYFVMISDNYMKSGEKKIKKLKQSF